MARVTTKGGQLVSPCACGAERRKFWLWRDGDGVLHASGFAPTSGGIRAVFAATARDALLPLQDGGVPKHAVTDAEDPSASWDGRCAH
jgi:hypothetical protein